eukprot:sb/3468663/
MWSEFLSTDISSSTDSTGGVTETTQLSTSSKLPFERFKSEKKYSELVDMVPKEVIQPTSETNDLLFQWRLKRRIADAHASGAREVERANFDNIESFVRNTEGQWANKRENLGPITQTEGERINQRDQSLVPDTHTEGQWASKRDQSLVPDTQTERKVNESPDKNRTQISSEGDITATKLPVPDFSSSCSREVQTDAEKMESSCQTSSPYKRNKPFHSPCHTRVIRETEYADSLSDFSVSSFSTDRSFRFGFK